MPSSMTGFGVARRSVGSAELVVEARSVNSRALDIKIRLPRELGHLEGRIQAAVRARIQRGRVDLSLDLADPADAARQPRVNLPLARGYAAALGELSRTLGLADAPTLALVWSAPGVVEVPTRDLGATLEVTLDAAVSAALDGLEAMRRVEGAHLALELGRLLAEFAGAVDRVAAEVPRASASRKSRLESRLAELLGDIALDPVRLAQEVAVMVDRADVTEELARLDSHLAQLRALLTQAEPIGRRLEFLLQEVHRETNTIGSKAATAEISHAVVDAKSVLERLKEQAQNLE
jgi:uncharacterized protein (TIGR00255 family)